MKLFWYPALAVSMFIFSCKNTDNQKINSTNQNKTVQQSEPETIKIDSIRVSDSTAVSKTLTLVYGQKVLLLSGISKPILDSLYKQEAYDGKMPLAQYSKESVRDAIKKQMQKYFEDSKIESKEYMPVHKQTWDRVSEMNVHSNANDFLTVRYDGYGYTGGAHGYAYQQYKTVDTKNQKLIKLTDIVDISKVNWNDVILKNMSSEYRDLLFEPKKIMANENFFFDQQGITFVYGQYEIAPYAAGIIPAKVPYTAINAALRPDFKKRLGIN